MARTVFSAPGGTVSVPDLLMIDRHDGGHLVVGPARVVWERSELSAGELCAWAALVAATGWAMMNGLSQLEHGCINYWEAGNWALHHDADPIGPKNVPVHRHVHLHVIGRSRTAAHPSWQWGEAPQFPRFKERHEWARPFAPLTHAECDAIARRIEHRLTHFYADGARAS